MKIDFAKLKKVGNRYYLMPEREGEPMLALNETCKIVIEALSQGKSIDEIVNYFTETYDIPRQEAENDIHDLVQQMKILNVLY